MKFLNTIVVDDITWIYFQSTLEEYYHNKEWCEKNTTSWAIVAKFTPADIDSPGYHSIVTQKNLVNRLKANNGDPGAIVKSKIGFKRPDDALRFKLSI